MFHNPRLNRNSRINLDDEEIPNPPKLERTSSHIGNLIPHPVKTRVKKLKFNQYQEARIIPQHPESALFIGGSGTGKTTLLLFLLTEPHLLGAYFDKVKLFSFTGKADPSFKVLNLKDEDIITENMIEKLEDLLKKRQKLVDEKGLENVDKLLLIFEDVSANFKFIKSKQFTKCFTACRHFGISVYAVCHKYSACSRISRLQANHLYIFPSPNTEMEVISQDHTPPRLTKKEMRELISYAWQKGDDIERPFLNICMKSGFKERYRRGLHEILELNDFD